MHLAQINIARMKAPLDSPQMKDFVDNLVPINALAENSAGFIWRLQDEIGDATAIQAFEDPDIITNLSVWESLDALKNFMFKTDHVKFMQRRSEWFHRLPAINHALWWVPEGHIPTLMEAKEKLEYLRKHGDTESAFSLRKAFDLT